MLQDKLSKKLKKILPTASSVYIDNANYYKNAAKRILNENYGLTDFIRDDFKAQFNGAKKYAPVFGTYYKKNKRS